MSEKIKPMKVGDAHSSLQPSKEVNKMVKALEDTKLFTVVRDSETIRIHHTESGSEVFAALRKGATPFWIVRVHKKLFQE